MDHEQGSQGLGLHRVHRAVSLEDAESIADAEAVAEDESVADAVANVAADEVLLVCFFCHNIAHHT